MRCTTNHSGWKLLTALVVVSGCAPTEPAAPEPEAPEPAAQAVLPDSPPPDSDPAAAVKDNALEPPSADAISATGDTAAENVRLPVSPTDERTGELAESIARAEEPRLRSRIASYRGAVGPAEMPPVVFSKGHEALCRVKVGDTMPEITLPRITGGGSTTLAELAGEKATVVVFWSANRRMAREQLMDLPGDVVELFGDRGVAVVGIAVNESDSSADAALRRVGADFPNLIDGDGKAFEKVGAERLPQTYLLDPQGKILWFDIEYSLATRRELYQALRALVGEPDSADE
jgi:peroxiredoxin